MDRKRTGSDARNDQSIEQLIKEAYGLNTKQLEMRMKWAMEMAESGSLLRGMSIPEAPDNEFRIIMAKMAARGITPKLMADFDEETQKEMQREDYLDTALTLPHQRAEREGTKNPVADVKEYLESKKKQHGKAIRMAGAVAACLVFAMAVILVPRIDAIAKKNYKYEARVESGRGGIIVWNNQDNVIMEEGSLEKAYAEIKEKLGGAVLKLNYIPKGMKLSKLEIKAGITKMEFVYAGNAVHMFEVLYLKDSTEKYISDRNEEYKVVKNEWIDKNIPIQKNKTSEGKLEYCAYFEMNNAFFVLEGIVNEEEFIKVIENVSVE